MRMQGESTVRLMRNETLAQRTTDLCSPCFQSGLNDVNTFPHRLPHIYGILGMRG